MGSSQHSDERERRGAEREFGRSDDCAARVMPCGRRQPHWSRCELPRSDPGARVRGGPRAGTFGLWFSAARGQGPDDFGADMPRARSEQAGQTSPGDIGRRSEVARERRKARQSARRYRIGGVEQTANHRPRDRLILRIGERLCASIDRKAPDALLRRAHCGGELCPLCLGQSPQTDQQHEHPQNIGTDSFGERTGIRWLGGTAKAV